MILMSSAQGELSVCSVPLQEFLPDTSQPADWAAAILGQTHQSYEKPRYQHTYADLFRDNKMSKNNINFNVHLCLNEHFWSLNLGLSKCEKINLIKNEQWLKSINSTYIYISIMINHE